MRKDRDPCPQPQTSSVLSSAKTSKDKDPKPFARAVVEAVGTR